MSIVRPDLVSNRQPLISSCTIQTVTGSPVEVLGKVHVRLGLLGFGHQMLVPDIVDEVILGTDIMSAYGFVLDLRENVLKVGQEKIKPVSYTHLDVYKRQISSASSSSISACNREGSS